MYIYISQIRFLYQINIVGRFLLAAAVIGRRKSQLITFFRRIVNVCILCNVADSWQASRSTPQYTHYTIRQTTGLER